ncbi:uncharacterized protein LOC6548145 isoform X2 [Drosophila erecta]|uniref:uncharacterized protein LOC6548145 isoform X2 n=1 Tax=Drosophila erecta TaxID=7220 RepID=UPI000F063301|nr:uncharacterized protein LOC6548145 isoform X2 [Drosophila erecta]
MFLDTPQKPPRTLRYVEIAFDQIKSKQNVRDVVILNDSGHPVMSTMVRDDAVQFSGPFQAIRGRLERGMSKIDPTDELLMLRTCQEYETKATTTKYQGIDKNT